MFGFVSIRLPERQSREPWFHSALKWPVSEIRPPNWLEDSVTQRDNCTRNLK
jgi:hypothetical protein